MSLIIIAPRIQLKSDDKYDNCMPALGDKGKGGGEQGKAAEEQECFHFLKRAY